MSLRSRKSYSRFRMTSSQRKETEILNPDGYSPAIWKRKCPRSLLGKEKRRREKKEGNAITIK